MNEIGPYKRHAGHLTVRIEDGYGFIVFMKQGINDNVLVEWKRRYANTFQNFVPP